jgi:hypothetical protein
VALGGVARSLGRTPPKLFGGGLTDWVRCDPDPSTMVRVGDASTPPKDGAPTCPASVALTDPSATVAATWVPGTAWLIANTAHRHGVPPPTAAPVVDVDDVGDAVVVGAAVLVGSVVTEARGTVGSDEVAGWPWRLVCA